MMHRKILLLMSMALTLLTGCWGGEHDDLRSWIAERKSVTKPMIRPLKEPSVFAPQGYSASNGMDPFNMLKLTQVLNRESEGSKSNLELLKVEQNRHKEELESYPLDNMKMVGSMRKDGGNTALLRVNQLIYQVQVGNYLGQNYGRILEVGEHSLKLREVVQDPTGDWVERVTTLDLQEGE
ncbi:pilus assembly protein PilP [Comamonas sp. NoAH]|uniref:pilus assembly protein PilP n=1 Tax=Comamonas halotolerans TaxID=3041496 RepID=UPI0032EA63C3